MALNTWETAVAYKTPLMVYGLGAFALVAGLSKFVAPQLWAQYNPSWFPAAIPLTATTWMYFVGAIEAAVGGLILSRWNTHIWAAVTSAWLIIVTVAVATAGYYDVAWRDVGLAVFALTVALEAWPER